MPHVPRPVAAVSAVVGLGVLLLVWASTAGGQIEGHVFMTGCYGNPPQGAPPSPTCSKTALAGATVVASSADRPALAAHTDRSGRFSLRLPAGIYMVAAWMPPWQEDSAGGIRSHHPGGATPFGPVRITGGTTLRVEVSIPSVAM